MGANGDLPMVYLRSATSIHMLKFLMSLAASFLFVCPVFSPSSGVGSSPSSGRASLRSSGRASSRSSGLQLALDGAGRIVSLKDALGGEWAEKAEPGFLLQLVLAGKTVAPLHASVDRNVIILSFPGGKIARIVEDDSRSYLRYELTDISAGVDAVVWGPVNTTVSDTIGQCVGVVRNVSVAIGIQGLNAKTSGGQLVNEEGAVFDRGTTAVARPFGSSLQAFTVNRSMARKITVWGRWEKVPVPAIPDGQLKGSAIALFACRPANVLAEIETITRQEHLPYPKWAGDWIKHSPAPGLPYMITTFSESNVDSFLRLAKRMGMAGVYHEDPFETWGNFRLKKESFPHGRAGFKVCATRAHAMGLRLGFHVLSNFITTNDAYVTPKPDPRLASAGIDTLVEALSTAATEIVVRDTFYFAMRSDLNTVRIGDELIRYMSVTPTPPYRLTGCTRGAFGTTASLHPAGSAVSRLIDHGYKVFFPDWQLQKEMAGNIARFINETGADQMDFDGHEGTYATGMGDYSLGVFAEEVFRQADHPVVFGSSRANHYFWHVDDYLNWGEPWYGGFRESQSDYRIANQRFYEANYLPNMLGWFLLNASTTTADIDWMLARAAGFHAGYALVVRKDALKNPFLEEIISHIRAWTEATKKGLFTEEQRAWMRDPGNDVALDLRGAEGKRETRKEGTPGVSEGTAGVSGGKAGGNDGTGSDGTGNRNNPGGFDLQRFRKYEFTYAAKVLQPGEPTYQQYSFDNGDTKQTPQLVITADGDSGTIAHPVIELDNSFRLVLPITLSAGETLVLARGDEGQLYNAKGRFLRSVKLAAVLPELGPGMHQLSFDAVMDAGAPVKARITLKLAGKKEAM